MARTKKFLNSKTKKTGIGFYRPIKRLKKPPKVEVKTKPQPKENIVVASKSEKQSQLTIDLKKKMQEIEDLKITLNQQITERLQNHQQEDIPSVTAPILEPELNVSKQTTSSIDNLANSTKDNDFTIDWQAMDGVDYDDEATTRKILPQQQSQGADTQIYEQKSHNIDLVNPSNSKQDMETELLKKELINLLKERKQYERDIKSLKVSLTEEREKMEKTINSLKKKVDHPNPVNHNRFFSISDELGSVVKAMNTLVSQNPELNLNPTDQASNDKVVISATQPVTVDVNHASSNDISQESKTVNNQPVVVDAGPKDQSEKKEKNKKNDQQSKKRGFKIPKPLVVLGTTLLIVGAVGGGVWFYINHDSAVNTNLVQEYLPNDNQTGTNPSDGQSATQNNQTNDANKIPDNNLNEASASANVKGVSDVATNLDNSYKESQTDTSFSDTKWDTFSDASFKLELTYPINSVNMVRTDSSVTFLRKTGYVFKIQVVDSILDLDQYWQLVGFGGLKYKSKSVKFRDHEALFLQLDEDSDYPGDRYLVKFDDKIYDIWYATFGPNLSDDDAKRVDIMLNSFKFLEDKNNLSK